MLLDSKSQFSSFFDFISTDSLLQMCHNCEIYFTDCLSHSFFFWHLYQTPLHDDLCFWHFDSSLTSMAARIFIIKIYKNNEIIYFFTSFLHLP